MKDFGTLVGNFLIRLHNKWSSWIIIGRPLWKMFLQQPHKKQNSTVKKNKEKGILKEWRKKNLI